MCRAHPSLEWLQTKGLHFLSLVGPCSQHSLWKGFSSSIECLTVCHCSISIHVNTPNTAWVSTWTIGCAKLRFEIYSGPNPNFVHNRHTSSSCPLVSLQTNAVDSAIVLDTKIPFAMFTWFHAFLSCPGRNPTLLFTWMFPQRRVCAGSRCGAETVNLPFPLITYRSYMLLMRSSSMTFPASSQ